MKKLKYIPLLLLPILFIACNQTEQPGTNNTTIDNESLFMPDTLKIPDGKYGDMVKYGRELMLNTAYYIGPEGMNGHYTGNKMNCTNCHQQAGTKPFALNLVRSHEMYPQYRAREGRVLSLAERVNNCVMRPHNGKPLPFDGKEMVALLSYLRWINSEVPDSINFKGDGFVHIDLSSRAASPEKGQKIYQARCQRCHGAQGEGVMAMNEVTYTYPPLWGANAYQPGSSMHRILVHARWIKANMPYDSAKWDKPVLTDEEALDVAAFINDDRIHERPNPKTLDYPFPKDKAIDYGKGPYADTFSEAQHKFGPYQPIVDYWTKRKPNFKL
jgi:thiosulfate dehydrogenase